MAKAKSGGRKAGRPRRYQKPARVYVKFEAEFMARIDRLAAAHGQSRNDWIRAACERELERLERRRQKG